MTRRIARTAGLILAALALAVLSVLAGGPRAQAAQTTRLTASDYGNAIYYDTDYRNGYQWKRFERGTSRNFDSNDAIKTSGKSVAFVRGLYRVLCQNVTPNQPALVAVDEDDAILQAYPKAGCKNS